MVYLHTIKVISPLMFCSKLFCLVSFFFFNDTATTEIFTLTLNYSLFFFNDTATTEIYTLSLHDALPISPQLWAGLMKFNVNFEAIPYVAEKVASNRDGSVWTFTLRRDSKWSDGGPCTAKD